jgi:hypothetical protein
MTFPWSVVEHGHDADGENSRATTKSLWIEAVQKVFGYKQCWLNHRQNKVDVLFVEQKWHD